VLAQALAPRVASPFNNNKFEIDGFH
jgi:hypothetical protein